jgi:hypothetical protein
MFLRHILLEIEIHGDGTEKRIIEEKSRTKEIIYRKIEKKMELKKRSD